MNNGPVALRGAEKIFISYRRADSRGSAERLSTWLKHAYGSEAVFLDVENIKPGTQWRIRLDEAVRSCTLMLVVIGPQWLDILKKRAVQPALDHVVREVHTALQANIKILPICLDGTHMPTGKELKFCRKIVALSDLQRILLDSSEWKASIQEVMKATEEETGLARLAGSPPDAWYVPSYTTVFSGREDIIKKVDETLQAKKSVALCGLPGSGKTEIAREYTRRHGTKYSICWLANAENQDTLAQAFRDLLESLKVETTPDLDIASLVTLFRERIQRLNNWLLILDNVENVKLVGESFSEWSKGHLLLTTTRRNVKEVVEREPVLDMSEDEGALLLLRVSGIPCESTPSKFSEDAALTDYAKDDQIAAQEISIRLGGLPLALDQAGAYIRTTGRKLNEFLSVYEAEGTLLREEYEGLSFERRHECVRITFRLAFDQLTTSTDNTKKDNDVIEGAKDLLGLCAFFAPDDIPKELLVTGAPEFGPRLARLLVSEYFFDKVIGAVLQYSLLRQDANQNLFHIHRQVQDVIKDEMQPSIKAEWAERAVRGVNGCLKDPSNVSSVTAFHQLWFQTVAAVDLMQKAKINISDPTRSSSAYTLDDFVADREVRDALVSGNSWEKLLAKDANYSTIYAAMHSFEEDETHRRMRRVIASLRRVLTDVRQARLAFCCMYFVAHYWWDIYLPDDNLCPPLLAMWRASNLPGSTGSGDDEMEVALDVIQAQYPPGRDYHRRKQDRQRWGEVRQAVETLRELLGLNKVLQEGTASVASERYVRAITNLYLAEASRYAPGDDDQTEAGLWGLYNDALLLFQANEDAFHESWAHFEYAQALHESGDRLLVDREDSAAAQQYQAANAQCSLAISQALKDAYKRTDEEGGGYYIDSELIGNAYRLQADILWIKEQTNDIVWFHYCAAVLGAYAFLFSEGDAYALAFYSELRERAMERLASVPEDAKGDVMIFIRSFWQRHWQEMSSDSNTERLFPPVPLLQEVAKPQDDNVPTPYRQTLGRVLSAMPEEINRLKHEKGICKAPLQFANFLTSLQKIPRFL